MLHRHYHHHRVPVYRRRCGLPTRHYPFRIVVYPRKKQKQKHRHQVLLAWPCVVPCFAAQIFPEYCLNLSVWNQSTTVSVVVKDFHPNERTASTEAYTGWPLATAAWLVGSETP